MISQFPIILVDRSVKMIKTVSSFESLGVYIGDRLNFLNGHLTATLLGVGDNAIWLQYIDTRGAISFNNQKAIRAWLCGGNQSDLLFFKNTDPSADISALPLDTLKEFSEFKRLITTDPDKMQAIFQYALDKDIFQKIIKFIDDCFWVMQNFPSYAVAFAQKMIQHTVWFEALLQTASVMLNHNSTPLFRCIRIINDEKNDIWLRLKLTTAIAYFTGKITEKLPDTPIATIHGIFLAEQNTLFDSLSLTEQCIRFVSKYEKTEDYLPEPLKSKVIAARAKQV